jgi:hypothetical protein
MLKIEDFEKIWKPWTPIKADLESHGYQPGPISLDASRTDQRSAIFTTCPKCGHNCNYEGFNKDMRSYRSYAVCYSCDTARRLS